MISPMEFPSTDVDTWLSRRCDDALETAQKIVDGIKAGEASNALTAWNDLQIELNSVEATAQLLAEVHPQEKVRETADEVSQKIDAFTTGLGLDGDLFAALDSAPTPEGDDAARFHDLVRRDFRRAGVDRDEATRARLKELAEAELKASQEFGRNIRDGVREIKVRPEQLVGLPQDWLDARPAGDDGLVTVTTDYPDSVPLMSFCADREVRREMALARNNIAWPKNDEVLQRIFAMRQEHAGLLGYATWADFDAEIKMIKHGSAIGEFVDRIVEAARPRALEDKQVLLDRLRQDVPDADEVQGYDTAYYSEIVRKENYAVDAQEVRRYFDFDAVRQGLLDVTGRLFGLEWKPVDDAVTWHEDVTTYDVIRDGERIGRIHLDLHPREGKYKHAAQFPMQPGINGRRLPQASLVCNFSRGLMEHSEVVTFFHEFGHLVHDIVGGANQEWARFSGVATEWDFVEAPSQMLEEWAWDADVLAQFARNAEGEPIPAELVDRMRKAEDFGKGFYACTQMFYAAISLGLHVDRPGDITTYVRQTQEKYSVFPYVEDTHFHCSFGHLDGYGSGYYTYMWSLVIAKDMFSAFDRDDMFDPEVAGRYRDRILAMGGRKDAADLVADFLGREYTFDAYEAWLAE